MNNRWWTWIGVIAIVVLLIGGFLFLTNPPLEQNEFVPGIGGGPEDTTISEIIRDPSTYLGQNVTLLGEVDRVITPRLFVLDKMGTVTGDEILVLADTPLPEDVINDINVPLQDREQVVVTGTVANLVITEVEQDLDFDLDREIELEFQNRPLIQASSVQQITNEQQ